MDKDWRDILVQRHPRFFAPGGRPTFQEGWSELLERTLGRIAAAMGDEPEEAVFRIVQTKEKFGTLRIYYQVERLSPAARAAIQDAIDLGEARSACTCEVCGGEGQLHDDEGWYATRCRRHAVGDAVPVRRGWSNLRIVRSVHHGGIRIDSCRRYDRAADGFVDAPLPDGWDED